MFVEVVAVDTQKIVDVSERFIELNCPGNITLHCFNNKFILVCVKKKICLQRCAVRTHRNTDNLSKHFTAKTDEDVIDKKINCMAKIST